MSERYYRTEQLLKDGVCYDAWIKNRRINYSSIEGSYPLFCKRAKGCKIWDVDDNEFIDYTMGYGTVLLGHADDRVNQAVIDEIKLGTCMSPMWKETQIKLAQCIHEIIPNAENVFFMKTGSDATSGAVRLARCFTGRNIVLRWGYNGWHDWATPRPLGVPQSVQRDVISFEYNSLSSLEECLNNHKGQVACVIMMPFELEMPSKDYLFSAMELVHRNGALFILDEMRSGFRVSIGGAQEYFGIVPDLATYSKAMANGYPISAITGRADVLSFINKTKMTATYFSSSFEMVAALKTIEIIRNTGLTKYIWEMGNVFVAGMRDLIDQFHIKASVLGIPPMPFVRFDYGLQNEDMKHMFYSHCANNGVILHPNHHWYISGSHTINDINSTLNICESAFKKIAGK